jgi:hypothetical protein
MKNHNHLCRCIFWSLSWRNLNPFPSTKGICSRQRWPSEDRSLKQISMNFAATSNVLRELQEALRPLLLDTKQNPSTLLENHLPQNSIGYDSYNHPIQVHCCSYSRERTYRSMDGTLYETLRGLNLDLHM